jgi:hypothetical protein
MTYATPDDVAVELGRPPFDPGTDAVEIAQIQRWLDRTESIIRLRIPDLDERVEAGTPPEAVVVDVESAVVARKVLNPNGLTSKAQTRTLDDWSETQSQTVGSEYMDGMLRLTDEEWELLLGGSSGEAFTIAPYGTPGRPYYWATTTDASWNPPGAYVPW